MAAYSMTGVIAAIIILAIAVAGGILLGPRTYSPHPDVGTALPTPTPAPKWSPLANPQSLPTAPASANPETNPTAHWRTYSGEKFTFRYPPTFVIKETDEDFLAIATTGQPHQPVVLIDARLSGIYGDFSRAVAAITKDLTQTQLESTTQGVQISGVVGPGYGEGKPLTIALFKYGSGVIAVEYDGPPKAGALTEFDQLLTTFTVLP